MLGMLQVARAADNVKTIEIIRDKGKFVFADPDVKIDAGQSVEWFYPEIRNTRGHELSLHNSPFYDGNHHREMITPTRSRLHPF
jgi:plastocyanin